MNSKEREKSDPLWREIDFIWFILVSSFSVLKGTVRTFSLKNWNLKRKKKELKMHRRLVMWLTCVYLLKQSMKQREGRHQDQKIENCCFINNLIWQMTCSALWEECMSPWKSYIWLRAVGQENKRNGTGSHVFEIQSDADAPFFSFFDRNWR